MEKLIEEIKRVIPFKESTEAGDLVLIIAHHPKMLIYALVSAIQRDSTRLGEWWNIELTLLTMPLQKTVWTLRTAQMTGRETFTMGGEHRFFKAVDLGHDTLLPPTQPAVPTEKKNGLKRIK